MKSNASDPLTPAPTVAYRAPDLSSSLSSPRAIDKRCFFGGTGGRFGGEIQGLLRGRLQLVTLIILLPSLILLIRNIVQRQSDWMFTLADLVFQFLAFVSSAAFAALLWSRLDFSLKQLRLIELGLFGVLVLFFCWLQFDTFNRAFIGIAQSGKESEVLRLLALGSLVRWLLIIILYGVFIPNTWRRCAIVVGGTALLPVAITAATTAARYGIDGQIGQALFDMTVLLATGCLIAVFGSYRIHVLHKQAFEARQLGQYTLKRKLGAGGMGEVYLAEHLLLRRPCAVKLIRPDQAGHAQNLQRFEREVRAMASLTHWNTVEIFDYGHTEEGTFYYVMEYLPGINLDQLVTRYGPLPPERAVHFLRQVCRALREAHQSGLLHRDIKPSNIIACERGGTHDVAKLLDFGLVQGSELSDSAQKLTVQGTILGSPPFVSPEQALGRKDLDARSDIYSIGAVAYFLLTGQPPFPRETAMEMLLAHAYEPVTPLREVRPDLSADIEEVVMRCLRKKADERYGDVAVLEKAFAACGLAELWTEEMATRWWRERPNALQDTREMVQPTVAQASRL